MLISGAVGPGDHENETSSIWLVSILGGKPRRLRGNASRAVLSPDDSLVAYMDGAAGKRIMLADADGENPREFSADKGFYERMDRIEELEADIEVVSIAKQGPRTEEQLVRESSKDFKLGQRFRAGVEGTISFLKRVLGMFRCRNKGWGHYVATVGASVFAHNLLILARSYE